MVEIMFGSKFTPDWKIVAGTLSIMVLGIALLHKSILDD